MRFQFQAIDEHGRVVRGVFSADDEAAARELLVSEHVYPKTLTPADDDAPVTWGPRRRVAEALEAHRRQARGERPTPRRAIFPTRAVAGLGPDHPEGQAGLDEAGNFVFAPTTGDPLLLSPATIEEARLAGFPRRLLRITTLDGTIHEFTAGWILATSEARTVAKALKG